ncbi:hypothetical protein D515_02822 [Grimontia indica]|uniref:Uncharacterized protein n=1 Tax=Grimontia indica TaxID=1056512 RepID=R1GQH8_9GAMM|nr:hypothetical protein D515_02822 [Grimontia indica]
MRFDATDASLASADNDAGLVGKKASQEPQNVSVLRQIPQIAAR